PWVGARADAASTVMAGTTRTRRVWRNLRVGGDVHAVPRRADPVRRLRRTTMRTIRSILFLAIVATVLVACAGSSAQLAPLQPAGGETSGGNGSAIGDPA